MIQGISVNEHELLSFLNLNFYRTNEKSLAEGRISEFVQQESDFVRKNKSKRKKRTEFSNLSQSRSFNEIFLENKVNIFYFTSKEIISYRIRQIRARFTNFLSRFPSSRSLDYIIELEIIVCRNYLSHEFTINAVAATFK